MLFLFSLPLTKQDDSRSWNTTNPLFSRCFRQTALGILPCFVYWIIFPIDIVVAIRSKSRPLLWSWLVILRICLALTVAILHLVEVIGHLSNNPFNDRESEFFGPLVKVISFAGMAWLFLLHRRRGVVTSGSSWVFSLVMTFFAAINTYHAVQDRFSDLDFVLSFLILAVMMMLLIACSNADKPCLDSPKEEHNPREFASFPSMLTFWWFTPLAYRGYKTDITTADLFPLREEDKTKNAGPLFQRNWTDKKNAETHHRASVSKKEKELSLNEIKFQSTQTKSDNSAGHKGVGVIRMIWKSYGWYLLVGSLFKLCQDTLQFVNPRLLKWLIQYISDLSEPYFHGLIIVFFMFIVSNCQSIFLAAYFDRMLIASNRIRSGLTAMIYQKALRLKNSARKDTTVGEIVNLMAVDTQRLVDIMTFINLIWSAPFQIIVAIYCIYLELGVAVFAGVAVMVIMMPINAWIVNISKRMQQKQMKLKDERVKTMNEILNGAKVIKLYAWEESFMDVVLGLRNREILQLKLMSYLSSVSLFLWTCVPFLVALVSFGIFVLLDERNVLDAEKAFVSLTYFNILRFPLVMLPNLASSIVMTWVSIKRLNKYLNAPQLVEYVEYAPDGPAVNVSDGCFSWDAVTNEEKEAKLTLKNINVSVNKGSLVAVVGSVGSGKSSLISAILGEMEKVSGRVTFADIRSIAYVPQQAWIQNLTLKDNILFGCEFDRHKYSRIIDVCELKPDLEILPAGDETEIGEKGINLSGGQKQRVNLARACYSDSDLYLLDDPLSAVDSHVAKNLFDRVISSKTGILRKKTRILVTNNLALLPFVDQIIVMKNGTVSENGTYKTLMENKGDFADFVQQFSKNENHKTNEDDDEIPIQRTLSMSEGGDTIRQLSVDKIHREDKKRITGDEKTETGNVKASVYIEYFKSIRPLWLVTIVVGLISYQVSSAGANYWLSLWSTDKPNVVNGTTVQDIPQRNLRLGIYGMFGFLQAVTIFLGVVALVRGSIDASVNLHKRLLYQILRSPMMFFDTTPIGRIVNRFSKDIDTVDSVMLQVIRGWISYFLQVVETVFMIAIATPWFLIVTAPIAVLYYYIQKFYVPTSRQLKRLESVTRSPVYSHFGETLSGVSTIRAYDASQRFIQESNAKIDKNATCSHCTVASNRWLAIRLEFCKNCILVFAALFAVLSRESIDAGLTGLSLSYALSVTQTLNCLVRSTSEIETNIVSVERILEYCANVCEADWTMPSLTLNPSWPDEGKIVFEKYATRYRPGLDLVVKDIDIVIYPREKIGIVGRTGAGKSTITLSLFRLIEPAAGRIIVDDIDITTLGLHQLRKRLTIIPQDPVLFSGTLRFNLDPFSECNDHELWTCLEHAHLKTFVNSLDEKLDYKVSEGGENLSVGQKQLFCLARALLRKTRILILDEATAAVDLETDSLIQSTIKENFKDCTIITIAHRLHTIMDSTRVLVLDQGKVVEFDSPESLLKKNNSIFFSLAQDAGIVSTTANGPSIGNSHSP